MKGTAPSTKLDVNGTIRAQEIKVEANPWPDYVFADDYQLSTLEETASNIQANHHDYPINPKHQGSDHSSDIQRHRIRKSNQQN